MSAIFFLVVLYLIIGATVFSALEQPHENSQKLAILAEKLDFLAMHACVNSSELEALVKVSGSFNKISIIQVLSALRWRWLDMWKKRILRILTLTHTFGKTFCPPGLLLGVDTLTVSTRKA